MTLRKSLAVTTAALALVIPTLAADASILWISDANDNIGQVDTVTGQVIANSVHNTGQPLTDIAFDSTGQMYGTTFTQVFQINKNTGAVSGAHSYSNGENGMNALFGTGQGAGSLLGASFQNNNVYSINGLTGAVTISTHGTSTSAGDIAAAGSLFATGTGTGSGNTLENLTANTSQVLHVGSPAGQTLNAVFGLADDGTTMFGVSGTEVYSVNLATAVLTPLFDYSLHENGQNLGSVTGAAFVGENGPPPAVPEPASLALLGVGLLGTAAFSRRKRQV